MPFPVEGQTIEHAKEFPVGKYYITAKVTARPGQEEALKAAILDNIPRVRGEKGCERYDLVISRDNSAVFLFDEIWSDKNAFEAHGKAPHMQEHRKRTADMVTGPTEIGIWKAVNVR